MSGNQQKARYLSAHEGSWHFGRKFLFGKLYRPARVDYETASQDDLDFWLTLRKDVSNLDQFCAAWYAYSPYFRNFVDREGLPLLYYNIDVAVRICQQTDYHSFEELFQIQRNDLQWERAHYPCNRTDEPILQKGPGRGKGKVRGQTAVANTGLGTPASSVSSAPTRTPTPRPPDHPPPNRSAPALARRPPSPPAEVFHLGSITETG